MRLLVLILQLFATYAVAGGHGPLFSLNTPTNGKGQWSLDFGFTVIRDQSNTGSLFRSIIGYGISEKLMLSFTAPYLIGQTESLTPALGTYEALASWRFYQRNQGVGRRLESMVFGGVIYPADQFGVLEFVDKTPALLGGLTAGLVSRSHYFWGGASYTAFQEKDGDDRPDLFLYSFAWGYRPSQWRKEYPSWDWRIFLEATGEMFSDLQVNGIILKDTDEHHLFVGPSILGQYKSLAIAVGLQVAVYRNTGLETGERFRTGINATYFF